MFIAEKHWGIELVQNANETSLTEHLMRFDPGGKYHQWGIIKDWIVLNFCTRFPAAKMACFNPRLYHVLFDEGHTNFTVVDSSLEKVEVPLTRLLYSS